MVFVSQISAVCFFCFRKHQVGVCVVMKGEFFSYRKDSKQSYGEIVALIGFT